MRYERQIARNTRATARSSAATARGTNELVVADRARELCERGWIKHSSTPRDVAEVEAMLAAQMRARIELQEGRPWPLAGPAFFGVIIAFLLALASISAVLNPASAVPFLVVLGWVGFAVAAWFVVSGHQRREAERSDVLARAVVRDGVCGWCGQPAPHVLEDEETEPRVFHALEIEREIDPKAAAR